MGIEVGPTRENVSATEPRNSTSPTPGELEQMARMLENVIDEFDKPADQKAAQKGLDTINDTIRALGELDSAETISKAAQIQREDAEARLRTAEAALRAVGNKPFSPEWKNVREAREQVQAANLNAVLAEGERQNAEINLGRRESELESLTNPAGEEHESEIDERLIEVLQRALATGIDLQQGFRTPTLPGFKNPTNPGLGDLPSRTPGGGRPHHNPAEPFEPFVGKTGMGKSEPEK